MLPLLSRRPRPELVLMAGGLLVAAAGLAILLLASGIVVDDGMLCVRHYSLRRRCIRLAGLRSVTARPGRFGGAPALDLIAGDGARVGIGLGSWRDEETLLAILGDAAAQAHARVDTVTGEILRDRPPASRWRRRNTRSPRTAIGRTLAGWPRPVRWTATIVLWLVAALTIYGSLELATRFSENVLFPRRIDPSWADRSSIAGIDGDTWVGNLAASPGRIVLATREDIQGFWGSIRVRASVDGGATWSAGVPVSEVANAARHTMVAGPGGSLVAAWSQQGPAPSTQRLVVRGSPDGGDSWSPPIVVATPVGGLVGLPALVVTETVRVVAFTDGQTGEIWTQVLTTDGAADGQPTKIGESSRQLYRDAQFDDGALALASIGQRVLLSYVDGDRHLHVMISDDGGRSWRASGDFNQPVYGGQPRLATDGSTVLLVVTDPNLSSRAGRRPFIRIWRSADRGSTWERGSATSDVAGLGPLELSWSGGLWRLVYAACPGLVSCATPPRIWYAESGDGDAWSDASILSEAADVTPVGVVADQVRVSAVWAFVRADHHWSFQVSRRLDERRSADADDGAGQSSAFGRSPPFESRRSQLIGR
jgi:hypothetical protein